MMDHAEVAFPEAAAFPMTEGEWTTRLHLAASYRLMAAFGFHDMTYNHLSARVPDAPGHYLIKGEGQLFEQVTASSLLLYDFEGQKLRPSAHKVSPTGLVIHGGVMQARADIAAVFHTHSAANMGVAAQSWGLLPVCQHSMLFYNRIGYHEFAGFESDVEGRERLVRDLKGHLCMIMRNHGVLVCGRTVPEAYFLHHYLEMACRAQIAALSAGGPDALVLPAPEICEHSARQMDKRGVVTADGRDWPALYALAKTLAPDFDR
jgi:ribulose-5-phosphate 4-epimerase/fuculose-1-phosphate aldolase